jgi:hypothetical protein
MKIHCENVWYQILWKSCKQILSSHERTASGKSGGYKGMLMRLGFQIDPIILQLLFT